MKWNLIDRLSSQALYGVTGIILARLLSQEDFGLVGAILVFQAFASLLVDSGFSYALIQRKRPTRLDYSTILWFNLAVATVLYVVLYLCAPLIADLFQGDRRLIPLSRVMFLSFILNASAIVQTNRLTKQMNVAPIAATNALGLLAGAVTGIWLAIAGYGAWAIVWQTLALNAVKSLSLWIYTRWLPLMRFSFTALRSFFAVGSGMMLTSFLNVLFQNIYSFFIGNRVGLASLGYYTQADKWSKMGITSVSQMVTSSFLPALSDVQDDPERFARVTAKMNRACAYLVMPSLGLLIAMATPIFHVLFSTKWDASIVLFQLLLARGFFTVLNTLYTNFLIAREKTRIVVAMETLRDGAALLFLVAVLPWIALSSPEDPVRGIRLLLYGQVAASVITWIVMLIKVAPYTGRRVRSMLLDLLPYLLETAGICLILWLLSLTITNDWMLLGAQAVTGIGLYLGVNAVAGSAIQKDLLQFLLPKNRKIAAE